MKFEHCNLFNNSSGSDTWGVLFDLPSKVCMDIFRNGGSLMSVQNDAPSLCELAAVLRDDHHKISVSTMGSHQILLNRIFSVHRGGEVPSNSARKQELLAKKR